MIQRSQQNGSSWFGWVFACLACSMTARACSVPVFRYALERWVPDSYEALVWHSGPPSPGVESVMRDLTPDGLAGEIGANVHRVRLERTEPTAGTSEDADRAGGDSSARGAARLILRYPRSLGVPYDVWSGALNAETVRAVLDSPARREIVRRLVNGDCAVWVLLESGEAEADDAAALVLSRRLAGLENELEIQKLDPDDIASGLVSVAEEELKVAFSMLRLSREDPEEAVFVEMLLGIEDDLRDYREPMAFPVFGRGRALYALVGAGIRPDNIDEACAFLVGPCSCQAKELNPGVDLLLAVNWDDRVTGSAIRTRAPPELAGLASFRAEGDTSREIVERSEPSASPEAPRRGGGGGVGLLTLAVASVTGLLLITALAGTLILLQRKR